MVAAEAAATVVVVTAVIAVTVVVIAMVTVVVTEGKSNFLCVLRVRLGVSRRRRGPPLLQLQHAYLSTPHFRLTFTQILFLLTLDIAEATEMATAAVVAVTAAAAATVVVATEEVPVVTVWALSALASRTKNGVCFIASLSLSHLLTFI